MAVKHEIDRARIGAANPVRARGGPLGPLGLTMP